MLKPALAWLALLAAIVFSSPLRAEAPEKRIALVIGNANYAAKPLATTANDAGLIAQTLQAAGFDVAGARDLDEDSLRHAFQDFVEKARGSGPDTVAFVYFAGYGLQFEGENYLVPINVSSDSDAPSRSMRVSDFLRPLAAMHLKLGIVVLDAARASPFSISGQPLAGGLALNGPGSNILLAFNAAPGTVAPEEKGPYGAYAQALAEMMREGGLSPNDVFERVRLRVHEVTKGAQAPWNSARIETPFVFFQRTAEAPPPAASEEQTAAVRSKSVSELGAQDAYLAAVARDTLQGYEEFVKAYPGDPLSKRVRAMIAARREAMVWRRTRMTDTPEAYWSYLRRYPRGPHAREAQRRLAQISAALEPPPYFDMIEYDVPPPLPEEMIYLEEPLLIFDDPGFGFIPPPIFPIYFLPPPPPDFIVLPPPIVIVEPYVLPIPVFVPIPVWQAPPRYVAPPPNNFFFANIHNTVVVNRATNLVEVKTPSGQFVSSAPIKPQSGGLTPVAASLPPSVARRLAQPSGFQPPSASIPPAAAPGAAHQEHGGVVPLPVPVPTPGKTLSPIPPQPAPIPGGQALPAARGKPVSAPSAAAPSTSAPAPLLRGEKRTPPVLGKAAAGAAAKAIGAAPSMTRKKGIPLSAQARPAPVSPRASRLASQPKLHSRPPLARMGPQEGISRQRRLEPRFAPRQPAFHALRDSRSAPSAAAPMAPASRMYSAPAGARLSPPPRVYAPAPHMSAPVGRAQTPAVRMAPPAFHAPSSAPMARPVTRPTMQAPRMAPGGQPQR